MKVIGTHGQSTEQAVERDRLMKGELIRRLPRKQLEAMCLELMTTATLTVVEGSTYHGGATKRDPVSGQYLKAGNRAWRASRAAAPAESTVVSFWTKARELRPDAPWLPVADWFGANEAACKDAHRSCRLPPTVSVEEAQDFIVKGSIEITGAANIGFGGG